MSEDNDQRTGVFEDEDQAGAEAEADEQGGEGEEVEDQESGEGGGEGGDGSEGAGQEGDDSGLSEQFVQRWDSALETLEQAANRARNNPTEQNVAAAEKAKEKAKSKLESLIESEELDDDQGKALKELASEQLEWQKKSQETEQRYQEQLSQQERRIAELSEQMYRAQFESKHPEISDQYDNLVKEASKDPKIAQAYKAMQKSNDPAAQQMFQLLWAEKWDQTVQRAAQKAKEKKGGASESQADKKKSGRKKDPKGAKVVNSRAGQSQGSPGTGKSAAEVLFGASSAGGGENQS